MFLFENAENRKMFDAQIGKSAKNTPFEQLACVLCFVVYYFIVSSFSSFSFRNAT